MPKKKYEEPLKVNMDFDEALERFARTDPRELSVPDERVHLVEYEESGDRFLIYGTDEGVRAELRVEGGTFWATQAQMASMFGVGKAAISKHLKNIYDEGELDHASTVSKMETVGETGQRYETALYDLNAVISVGYRINGPMGTMFRIWATDKLFRYLTKGFVVDVKRLKSPDAPQDRVAELREIVRDIRASEANTYREVRELCAMCRDYDKASKPWRDFYARMQNKLFWATVQTATTAVRLERADANAPNMGLTAWEGERIIQRDVMIAKNYLGRDEVERMNRLCVMLLDFIDDQLKEGRIATMREMEAALDRFIKNTGRPLMPERVRIPTKTKADEHCKAQYQLFKEKRAMREGEPDVRGLLE